MVISLPGYKCKRDILSSSPNFRLVIFSDEDSVLPYLSIIGGIYQLCILGIIMTTTDRSTSIAGKLQCDVIVVGAGLAGLAAAISIQRTGHRVTVLERMPVLQEVRKAYEVRLKALRACRCPYLTILDWCGYSTVTKRDNTS